MTDQSMLGCGRVQYPYLKPPWRSCVAWRWSEAPSVSSGSLSGVHRPHGCLGLYWASEQVSPEGTDPWAPSPAAHLQELCRGLSTDGDKQVRQLIIIIIIRSSTWPTAKQTSYQWLNGFDFYLIETSAHLLQPPPLNLRDTVHNQQRYSGMTHWCKTLQWVLNRSRASFKQAWVVLTWLPCLLLLSFRLHQNLPPY